MELDVVLLSRIQFAFTLAFHILFPTMTIGIAAFLVVLEGMWLATKRDTYFRLYRFWAKFFALSFGVGVVSGIVLSYEFGTNFSRFSDAVGNVIGPLMAYEVMTAFFLEAGFLGIMLFGMGRVRPSIHFFSTCMVSLGTMISTFWILSANSWMHTPQGFTLADGKFFVADWWDVIFNPSFPYRLMHMLMASFLTGAFIVAGISAWYLLSRRAEGFARRGFSLAMAMAAVAAPAQVLLGDMHGLNTLEHQPMKIAAMEGRWETMRGAPLILFGIPDMAAEKNHFEIGIPKIASLILTHELDGEIKGLKEVAPADRPNMPIVFFSFRIMVGIGFLLLAVALTGLVLRFTGRLYDRRWFLWACVAVSPLGLVATVSGWVVTEVGRQPWVVHGLMRTADGVSPIAAGAVATTLAIFLVVYPFILLAFLLFVRRIVRAGPDMTAPVPAFKPRHTTPTGVPTALTEDSGPAARPAE